MKTIKTILAALFLFSITSCNNYAPKESTSKSVNLTPSEPPLTSISFDTKICEFKDAIAGQSVTCVFKFKNTGSNPLIIQTIKSSCGCTDAYTPKDTIAPNDSSIITANVSLAGKLAGKMTTHVTVASNTDPPFIGLTIEGEIISPPPKKRKNTPSAPKNPK